MRNSTTRCRALEIGAKGWKVDCGQQPRRGVPEMGLPDSLTRRMRELGRLAAMATTPL